MDESSNDSDRTVQFKSSPGQPWHQDPHFHRYWQHYHDIREWYYTHWFPGFFMMQHNYHMPQYYGAVPPYTFNGTRSAGYDELNSLQHQTYCQWNTQYRNATQRTHNLTRDEEEDYSGEDSEGSEGSLHMEVSQEMKEFFAKSEKHREERKKEIEDLKQKIFSGKEQDYVNAEDLYKASVLTSCKPPTEKPGQKRRQEMKTLYGKDAGMIHGMETALQLQFDRNYDKKNPKLWPTIPLKL